MNWQANRIKARTWTNTPSKTDQSQANETDLNIIVGRMLSTGTVPGRGGEPLYVDWTQLPRDLRGMIEMGRSLVTRQGQLPPQLQHIPIDQLLTLTNQQIADILAPPNNKPTDEPK